MAAGGLTALGRILANLATDPQLGKMMVLGCAFSCIDPILTVIAALEYKSPFFITKVVICIYCHICFEEKMTTASFCVCVYVVV